MAHRNNEFSLIFIRIDMKRLGIYTVVTALLSVGAVASAHAQSKFEGAYGQLGIGFATVSL